MVPLREAMRDLQTAVAAYYTATAQAGDLGNRVRTFLINAQTLNDLFANAISDTASYASLFAAPAHAGANLVEGVKYARNVTQHVLHIVRPSNDVHLVGGTLGMRIYAFWDEIPPVADSKLRPGTRRLKPAYDATLLGREVTGTMLAVLSFYAEIAPGIVHRDQRGEWTGFPLMSQPGMSAPLHPEEPKEVAAAQSWLDDRPPNGDSRVVCGQFTIGETRYVYGHTLVGRYSFAPFVETVEQANKDVLAGFLYLAGKASKNLEDVSESFPSARQGSVLASREEVTSWASPINRIEEGEDWCEGGDVDTWHQIVSIERAGTFPEFVTYELRRARRLNALVPPGV